MPILVQRLNVIEPIILLERVGIRNRAAWSQVRPGYDLFHSDLYLLAIHCILQDSRVRQNCQSMGLGRHTGMSSTWKIHVGTCLGLRAFLIVSQMSFFSLGVN